MAAAGENRGGAGKRPLLFCEGKREYDGEREN